MALATRRAAPFYLAIGYEESAVYLRKIRPDGGRAVRPVSPGIARPAGLGFPSHDRRGSRAYIAAGRC